MFFCDKILLQYYGITFMGGTVLEYTTLTSKGQVTVPKEIREKFNWKEGTRLKFYIDGEELKVKEVTILDEMEDLITKDLIDLGYTGEELKTKLLERKAAFNQAFDRLLEERLKEETVPLEDAIRSIDNEEKL
jgi:AbrB family looped-hinge helix DNA binding protein